MAAQRERKGDRIGAVVAVVAKILKTTANNDGTTPCPEVSQAE
jgi:hypothetical protein